MFTHKKVKPMTEGERAFYQRRRREELHKANCTEALLEKASFLRKAKFFEELLDGRSKAALGPMPD